MAKDPAMLWYWNDWYSSTVLLSRFLKGCYVDLLHAQFNNGHLSLEEIKICLGPDFGSSWPALQKKFKQDENGLFFNERLEREQEKRRAFTEGRRKNLTKKPHIEDHLSAHMGTHVENENENENRDLYLKNNKESDFPDSPVFDDVHRVFKQQGGSEEMATSFFNKYQATGWMIRGSKVLNYAPLVSNFITNWNLNSKNGTHSKTNGKPQPAGNVPQGGFGKL